MIKNEENWNSIEKYWSQLRHIFFKYFMISCCRNSFSIRQYSNNTSRHFLWCVFMLYPIEKTLPNTMPSLESTIGVFPAQTCKRWGWRFLRFILTTRTARRPYHMTLLSWNWRPPHRSRITYAHYVFPPGGSTSQNPLIASCQVGGW